MLRHRFYYSVKPFVPISVRRWVRRWFVGRKRDRVLDTWPIFPGSERPPEGWPGWPDGKKFAIILTHDVEGPEGLAKVGKLMELEAKLGFRSAFKFIPEGGQYSVSKELRDEIVARGFEVGVHDLNHDGRLYSSHDAFLRKAARINKYLKDWGAVGFRSGFMLHNLDWLGNLNVLYEASTFDTDPFEPQPDGMGTIFPFWVSRAGAQKPEIGGQRREVASTQDSEPTSELRSQPSGLPSADGYLELPYTLVQDSTLFLLLRERHPDIWCQKLDWLAHHGGMALLNVHPDYVRFEGEPASSLTFPAEYYARFLEYANKRYAGSFWRPLPKDLAAYVAPFRPRLPRKPRRICMVTYSAYESDARVSRYAEALANRGDQVDVLAIQQAKGIPKQEKMRGVNVVRIQDRIGKTEKYRLSFLIPVLCFVGRTSLWIARQHRRCKYDVLHMHNVPDFVVFAAWYPRLTGAKVILDIHDILPEFYGNKFNSPDGSATIRILKFIERASAAFAHHVIIANDLWVEKYARRTGANGKCSVYINNVDADVFRPRPRTHAESKSVVIFPGGLQWHQGLDIAIRAFKEVRNEFPSLEFHIYGDGNMKDKLVALTRELGLNGSVHFFEPLPVRQVAEIMANADLAVVPKRADSFGNEAYSTKIMEFMSLGVPVIASSTKIDRFYFNDSVVRFFESGNHDSLAKAMLEVLRDPELRRRLIINGSLYAAKHSWNSRKSDYCALVERLLQGSAEERAHGQ